MKKRSRKAQLRRKHEFRYHKVRILKETGLKANMWHPAYIFLEKGNVYIYVSITHSDNVQNHVVVKMRKNPNPKDKTNSYYVDEIKQDTKDRFGKVLNNWEVDPQDDDDIQNLFKKQNKKARS